MNRPNYVNHIIVAVTLVIGGSFIFKGLKNIYFAQKSLQWPITEGRIISSGIEQQKRTYVKYTGVKKETAYDAQILYEYEIDGISYSGNRVAYAGRFFMKDQVFAKFEVKQYPTGEKVSVSYHPLKPETSVLKPGLPPLAWIEPAFGVIVILLGAVTAIALPRNRSLPAETLGSVSRKNLTNT